MALSLLSAKVYFRVHKLIDLAMKTAGKDRSSRLFLYYLAAYGVST